MQSKVTKILPLEIKILFQEILTKLKVIRMFSMEIVIKFLDPKILYQKITIKLQEIKIKLMVAPMLLLDLRIHCWATTTH